MHSNSRALHLKCMRRALSLARRGFGRCSPNPMVGAVLMRDGEIVGEGYHLYQRKDHAEALALRQAGERAKGATLYVNLEPCSHFGRTEPCADRLLQAGIAKAFVAIEDPNPLVAGRGIRRLSQSGVEVELGLCAQEALALNEAFLYSVRNRRPFVYLKLAMTLDGRIAVASGDSKWITGPEARREGHRMRYGCDAILVGSGTLLADDPSLDVRWMRRNSIVKVVLDSQLRTPAAARVFRSGDPVLLMHSEQVSPPSGYPSTVSTVALPTCREGLDWQAALRALDERKVRSLIVEGGGRTAASALRAGIVNRCRFFYGPQLVGGDGLAAIGDLGLERLSDAIRICDVKTRRLGESILVEGTVRNRAERKG